MELIFFFSKSYLDYLILEWQKSLFFSWVIFDKILILLRWPTLRGIVNANPMEL